MSEQTEKKILSPEQAVQAACILFELNTREQDLLEMAQRAGVPCGDDASRRALETLPKERVAFLSGMMAITMCAILDKLGQYEFGVE